MFIREMFSIEELFRNAANSGEVFHLNPVVSGGQLRVQVRGVNTYAEFAVFGNTLVQMPFAATNPAVLPPQMEPASFWADCSEDALGENGVTAEGNTFETLPELMACVPVGAPHPVQRVTAEPVAWAVNWFAGSAFKTALFASHPEAEAFCKTLPQNDKVEAA